MAASHWKKKKTNKRKKETINAIFAYINTENGGVLRFVLFFPTYIGLSYCDFIVFLLLLANLEKPCFLLKTIRI